MMFYYKQLHTEEERKIYLCLKNAVENHRNSIIIHGEVSGRKIAEIFRGLLLDYPDFFWTKGDFQLDERVTPKDMEYRIRFCYLCDEIESRNRGEQIQKVIAEICSTIQEGARPEHIVRSIFLWFQKNVSYFAASGADQTIYSALVMKQSVCMGIAKATTLLLRLYGIDSIVVMGTLFQKNMHAWNMICMDSRWYHTDVTVSYTCFDRVWAMHGVKDRRPLLLVKKEALEETHSLREGMIYPE